MPNRNYSQFWIDYGTGDYKLDSRFVYRDEDQYYELFETPNTYISSKVCTDHGYKYDSDFSFSIDTMLNL